MLIQGNLKVLRCFWKRAAEETERKFWGLLLMWGPTMASYCQSSMRCPRLLRIPDLSGIIGFTFSSLQPGADSFCFPSQHCCWVCNENQRDLSISRKVLLWKWSTSNRTEESSHRHLHSFCHHALYFSLTFTRSQKRGQVGNQDLSRWLFKSANRWGGLNESWVWAHVLNTQKGCESRAVCEIRSAASSCF